MDFNFISNPLDKIDFLKEKIESDGCAFFNKEFSEEEFINFGQNFGSVYTHRDSTSNGITLVKSVIENATAKSGYFGMTTSHLFPHTDRSTVETPPNILMFYCKTQETKGGESILIDGKVLFEILKEKESNNICPILEQNSAVFADKDNFYKGSIFEKIDDGSIYLRFRNDNFSFFNARIYSYLNELYKEMAYNQITFKLKKNQGYIINNGRFFHGRKGFSGDREMWRLLLNDSFLKQRGFLTKKSELYELDKIKPV